MKLPALDAPPRYEGLYIFDFGEWTAVGYTATEIATLLESEAYRGGKVYRIQRVAPDGRMELQGVSPERFQLESGLFFWRADEGAARDDFEALVAAGRATPPPCRAFVQLADWGSDGGTGRFVTALVYPAEHEAEISAWLTSVGCMAGDSVEGGISRVTNYQQAEKRVLEREQLWSHEAIPARSAADIFASVRRAVQR